MGDDFMKDIPDSLYNAKKSGTIPIELKTYEKVTKLLEDDKERTEIEAELKNLKAE